MHRRILPNTPERSELLTYDRCNKSSWASEGKVEACTIIRGSCIGNHSAQTESVRAEMRGKVSMGFLTLNTTRRHGRFLKLTFELETSESKKYRCT